LGRLASQTHTHVDGWMDERTENDVDIGHWIPRPHTSIPSQLHLHPPNQSPHQPSLFSSPAAGWGAPRRAPRPSHRPRTEGRSRGGLRSLNGDRGVCACVSVLLMGRWAIVVSRVVAGKWQSVGRSFVKQEHDGPDMCMYMLYTHVTHTYAHIYTYLVGTDSGPTTRIHI